jgi:hypothetical protein
MSIRTPRANTIANYLMRFVTRISPAWCCVLATLLVSVPLLSAATVGETVPQPQDHRNGLSDAASGPSLSLKSTPTIFPTPLRTLPSPPPMPAPAPTALPVVQPPPPPPGVCADALSVNVVDADLIPAVQGGIDLLNEYFGCRKFLIDGTGLTIKFGDITSRFNARVLGYADNTSAVYEIWLNPDCWGVVEGWDTVVAHELGHYLGWRHGDDHPYMWLTPPPGSYAQPGDLVIVCY